MFEDTATSTMSTSAASLTNLVDISVMLSSLQTAVDGYAIAISGLRAITSTPTLLSSMSSTLQLSADIGVMANRILEMANQLLAMADNIGAQADQIVLTQHAVNDFIALTQARVLAIQELSISLIALRS